MYYSHLDFSIFSKFKSVIGFLSVSKYLVRLYDGAVLKLINGRIGLFCLCNFMNGCKYEAIIL
jgi:hypothetical protein